ncbi:hypothetical protein KFK09_003803 [Dendrobium nobile]|uniref:Reverse transcriptase domain-containing protein n=1 Tax=Dendrobium nobile TaxID=94219 RepID=A0A8T3C174_DENNO|nr:hypothetical protein KFK09_003803 [Dendrobium nobile]
MCKDLISSHNLKLLGILEAKIQPSMSSDPWFCHSHKLFDNELCCDNFAFSNPGRIWLKWDSTAVSFSPSFFSSQIIHGLFSSGSSPLIFLSVIYAANQPDDRKVLWDSLLQISNNINLPWAIMGDFNCYRYEFEKVGGAPLPSGRLGELSNFIFNSGLQDLSSVGLLYTWFNQRIDLPIHIKLDRILVNSEFLDFFPNSHYKVDSPFGSDHSPLILLANTVNRTYSRFMFKKFWLNRDDFWEVLLTAFNSPNKASPIYAFYNCLKFLKNKIKGMDWSSSSFLSNAILEAKNHQLQCINALQISPLDHHLNSNLKSATENLNLLQLEWSSWIIQRAKSYWLSHGEDDLGFLYAKIRSRSNMNLIKEISTSQGLITGHQNIAVEHIEHFKKLFNVSDHFRNDQVSIPVRNLVPTTACNSLIEPFTDKDIKVVVFAGKTDSAPGPDDFSFGFYQQTWHIIGFRLCAAVRHFFTTGNMPIKAKATAITLIPKGSHAASISDYRPLSLCNVFYKIVAKLIANRLKPILPHIIHDSQAANELLKVFKGQQKFFCAKLDIKKAFDSVSRNFLLHRLKLKGFLDKFIEWVKGCIMDVHFSICLNGSLEGFFSSSSGLRQGCPLSPLLFCIAMDGLLQCLQQSSFVRLNQGSFSIKHLMYADDLLVFGLASAGNLAYLKDTMLNFSEQSSLHINPTKSSILFSKRVGNAEFLASILGISSIESSLTYLGLPITYNKINFTHFQPLISRIFALLEGWKVAYACNFSMLWDPWFCGDCLGNCFFDANLVGCEVKEFISNGAWSLLDCLPSAIKHQILTISVEETYGVHWAGISKPTFMTFTSHFDDNMEDVNWFKFIWHKKSALRYACYSWMAINGKLKCADKLILREFRLLLCVISVEGIMRLIHIFSLAVYDFINCNTNFNAIEKNCYFFAISVAVYHIWRERNVRRFTNTWNSPDYVKTVITTAIRAKIAFADRFLIGCNWLVVVAADSSLDCKIVPLWVANTRIFQANTRIVQADMKPGHIKSDNPKLKATLNKEKVEDKLIVKKGKKKFQRAFWADSASDSSEIKKEEAVTNLCLMADNLDKSDQEEDRSHIRPRESIWYLDSNCSKHMIGDTSQFILLEAKSGGMVTLKDNITRKVVESGCRVDRKSTFGTCQFIGNSLKEGWQAKELTRGPRNASEKFLSKGKEESFPRTSIIPKYGDRINITSLLSTVTYLILIGQPIDEAQLILDYLYGLSEIGHISHKRKKNIALGHLVAYILDKKYELVDSDVSHLEEPLFYNHSSFRAIFEKHDEGADTEGEERALTHTPAREPNFQDMVHRFNHLETHFDHHFDQIETHLLQ